MTNKHGYRSNKGDDISIMIMNVGGDYDGDAYVYVCCRLL
jgi:hypothetical protein